MDGSSTSVQDMDLPLRCTESLGHAQEQRDVVLHLPQCHGEPQGQLLLKKEHRYHVKNKFRKNLLLHLTPTVLFLKIPGQTRSGGTQPSLEHAAWLEEVGEKKHHVPDASRVG